MGRPEGEAGARGHAAAQKGASRLEAKDEHRGDARTAGLRRDKVGTGRHKVGTG